jgi:type I restriction enzyme, R subunit
LEKYVEAGVDELDKEMLPVLLKSKYQTLDEAMTKLGEVVVISKLFRTFRSICIKNR